MKRTNCTLKHSIKFSCNECRTKEENESYLKNKLLKRRYKMVKPKIKTITKKLPSGMKFVSYEYKGKKFNTKSEVMDAIRKGNFGQALYLKYRK